ncbi:uncharacterized protein [Clytia hemisphaerica]|uniref:Uncharacterized protein n=1 Tax=Clytia hemisphaerica TaxID=252671 RepID=A0A7M5WX74_9CNID|eukprot:TCONS_00016146-protein
MVTSIRTPSTYNAEHEVFVENSRVAIEQPFICVDGYIVACRFDGERCTPSFAISIMDLLNAVKTELYTLKAGVTMPKNRTSNSPPHSPSTSAKRLSPTMPHPLNYSRRNLFRQNSRDNNNTRKRFSDDLTGVSYDHIENTYRNSFLLPTRDNTKLPTQRESTSKLGTDLNDNEIGELDTKKLSELEPQIQWVQENCSDYVNTETVENCAQLNTLLNILMKMPSATLVTMKIVGSSEINVTYQFMDKFKQDYMVVKINPGYAMLMKTF